MLSKTYFLATQEVIIEQQSLFHPTTDSWTLKVIAFFFLIFYPLHAVVILGGDSINAQQKMQQSATQIKFTQMHFLLSQPSHPDYDNDDNKTNITFYSPVCACECMHLYMCGWKWEWICHFAVFSLFLFPCY